jgi:hypothetical protein
MDDAPFGRDLGDQGRRSAAPLSQTVVWRGSEDELEPWRRARQPDRKYTFPVRVFIRSRVHQFTNRARGSMTTRSPIALVVEGVLRTRHLHRSF